MAYVNINSVSSGIMGGILAQICKVFGQRQGLKCKIFLKYLSKINEKQ